ncbi:hypothetical protein PSTG_14228 [Puccinia striiformis f. sp. tritici PST-78]|uniref:Uncharacterized protein n=1 Tax=Puccinia striiformis f. sp. tritici PST-78 TaxID=1165861 RepID=A0A0L0UZB7_9BASI|nr:hypothetical protein PSTG_14228 [Puccinia striiformis f. sp. tritici PST-78]
MLQAHLDSQTNAFHRDYLPVGYPHDTQAQVSVVRFMRLLLKHERGLLRNLLLTNFREFNRRVSGPVPRLGDLVVAIDCAMGSRNQLCPVTNIQAACDGTTRIRIAFLRLAVVDYLVNRDAADPMAVWATIDYHLEHVRNQSEVFATLVIEKDRSLFQNRHIDDIPNAELRVPDDVEVHRKMARVARAP